MKDNGEMIVFSWKPAIQGTENMRQAVIHLQQETRSLCGTIGEVMKISGRKDYYKTAAEYGKKTADSLLVLQLRLGMVKNAIAEAAVPWIAAFVPALNHGIQVLTEFFRTAAQISHLLFSQAEGETQAGEAAQKDISLREKQAKAYRAVGKAVKKSLAQFDQLQRLNPAQTGGGGGAVPEEVPETEPLPLPIPDQIQQIVNRILAILAPLQAIDFSAASASFQGLYSVFSGFLSDISPMLEWLWFEVLTPLAKWTIEQAAPAAVGVLAEAFRLLFAVLEPVIEGFRVLWQALRPVFAFMGETALNILGVFGEKFRELAGKVSENGGSISEIFQMLAGVIQKGWEILGPLAGQIAEVCLGVFSQVLTAGEIAVSGFSGILTELVTMISAVFAGDFSTAWESIQSIFRVAVQTLGQIVKTLFGVDLNQAFLSFQGFIGKVKSVFNGVGLFLKGVVNGIIGGINGMLSGVTGGINGLIRLLNKFHFTFPDWIPELGGKSFGFELNTLTAPQIPLLAKGAVLPANRPFLAVVGDQKRGTNVEAPLATIQEAVAAVMGDMTGGMMAGFQATLSIQKDILEAVLGIQIGDELIAGAADRYQQKMAVVNGGTF